MAARVPKMAAAVLAAGSSSRMGLNKLLLEWQGESLLARAVGTAHAAGFDPLIAVVGFEAYLAADLLSSQPCRVVENHAHDLGMHSSAAVAVDAVAREAAALVILLADMPLVTASMLKKMKAQYMQTRSRLVVSRYGDVIAPPTLFDRTMFPHLQALEGGSVKALVERFWQDATVIDWHPSRLRDIDTPDDFAALCDVES